MPRKIFNGWQCVFLPVGKETRLTRGFEARGGEILSSLNTDSDLLIGDSWEEVVEHFSATPSLMEYFYETVKFVLLDWVKYSMKDDERLDPILFYLRPRDGRRMLDGPKPLPFDECTPEPPPTLPKCTLSKEMVNVLMVQYEQSGREQKRATEQAAYVLWHQKRVAQNLEREKKKLRKKHPYIDWEYPGTPERD
ncbi:unnamed protein product [Calypogeia fissa]